MRILNKELLKTNIEKRINADIASGRVGGASVIVRQNGKLAYKNCFGADVTEDTIFRLASMTKPITTVAVLMLIEQGRLCLNDTVEKYLPQFKDMHIVKSNECGELVDMGSAQTKPSVLHLLSHTSGIGSGVVGNIQSGKMTDDDRATVSNTIEFFANQGLAFNPFSAQAYSGTAAFDVLVAIIEKITGENYNDFLKKNIFEPLNMYDTTFVPSKSQWGRLITMHNYKDGKSSIGHTNENCVFENYPCTHYLGGAGLISTINDYSNFAEMLLNNGGQIVSEKMIKLMKTPQVPPEIMGGTWRWGLGVRVVTSEAYGYLPVGAYGWSGAYGGHFWIDPVNNITAVYMKNSRYDGGSGAKTAYNFEMDVNNALC